MEILYTTPLPPFESTINCPEPEPPVKKSKGKFQIKIQSLTGRSRVQFTDGSGQVIIKPFSVLTNLKNQQEEKKPKPRIIIKHTNSGYTSEIPDDHDPVQFDSVNIRLFEQNQVSNKENSDGTITPQLAKTNAHPAFKIHYKYITGEYFFKFIRKYSSKADRKACKHMKTKKPVVVLKQVQTQGFTRKIQIKDKWKVFTSH